MRVLRFDFNHGIRLWNLGDVHRGDHACDVPAFLKTVDEIARDPFARWLSTGDLLNVGLKDSKTGPYHSMNIDQECDQLDKELAPIKDKFVGMVKSNHHNRLDKVSGMSLDRTMFDRMKLPKEYFLGAIGVIAINVRGTVFYICLHHGIGGGRKRGGKANNAELPSLIVPGADLYMTGHTHSCDTFKGKSFVLDRKRGLLVEQTATYVVTGHYLSYESSYAPDYLYQPMPVGSAFAVLEDVPSRRTTEKRIKVDFFEP